MAVLGTAAAVGVGAGMGPLGWLGLGLTGIGAIGSLFGGEEEMTDEQRQAYEMLLSRSRGLPESTLEMMRARLKNAIGNEASGISASTASRLRRQNVPVAKQEEVLDKVNTRRIGGIDDAMLGVEELNESVKSGALGQLAGFTGRFNATPASGQGFGQMFGAGLQSLLRQPNPEFEERFQGMMGYHKQNAANLSRNIRR